MDGAGAGARQVDSANLSAVAQVRQMVVGEEMKQSSLMGLFICSNARARFEPVVGQLVLAVLRHWKVTWEAAG